eukprot:CAMPEP_0178408140 /NCGR_PEP_ID=MMETSP0689_2-20121128/19786_1 /TAXON_ID=160604 /ORGANISM="Amphidinium massartii, Strain CS-259" /LENGTH=436 /DNA_ID=CAMNT_0020029227 /DNA_START=145 /DNA_END=1451 /DNA_ORIENTATION=+
MTAVILPLIFYGVRVAQPLLRDSASPEVAKAFNSFGMLTLAWVPLMVWLVMMDPGEPPAGDQEEDEEEGGLRGCRHCLSEASAANVKHCKRCEKCVSGFDHHCLWLNTCIGKRNYTVWLIFIHLMFVWTLVGGALSWKALLSSLGVPSRSLPPGTRPILACSMAAGAVAAVFLFALACLHAYLNWNGLTTFEWIKGKPGKTRCHGAGMVCTGLRSSCYGMVDRERLFARQSWPPPAPARPAFWRYGSIFFGTATRNQLPEVPPLQPPPPQHVQEAANPPRIIVTDVTAASSEETAAAEGSKSPYDYSQARALISPKLTYMPPLDMDEAAAAGALERHYDRASWTPPDGGDLEGGRPRVDSDSAIMSLPGWEDAILPPLGEDGHLPFESTVMSSPPSVYNAGRRHARRPPMRRKSWLGASAERLKAMTASESLRSFV